MASKTSRQRSGRDTPRAGPADDPCVWMNAGVVTYRLCSRDHDCDGCAFYHALRGGGGSMHRRVRGFALDPGLFYHPRHTWARLEEGGNLRMGLDDMGQAVLGRIEDIVLPRTGSVVREEALIVRGRGAAVRLPCPVEGRVIEVNEKLHDNPALLNTHPYDAGWAAVVSPRRLHVGLRRLRFGAGAARWTEAELDRLRELLAEAAAGPRARTAVGTTLQDGGAPILSVLDGLTGKTTRRLIRRFFEEAP